MKEADWMQKKCAGDVFLLGFITLGNSMKIEGTGEFLILMNSLVFKNALTQSSYFLGRKSQEHWSTQLTKQRPEKELNSESALRKLIDHVVFICLERNSLWNQNEVCPSPYSAITLSFNKINWCNFMIYTSILYMKN